MIATDLFLRMSNRVIASFFYTPRHLKSFIYYSKAFFVIERELDSTSPLPSNPPFEKERPHFILQRDIRCAF